MDRAQLTDLLEYILNGVIDSEVTAFDLTRYMMSDICEDLAERFRY